MEEEISLKDLIISLWQGRYIIIITTVIAVLLAATFSIVSISSVYKATAHINMFPLQILSNDLPKYYQRSLVIYDETEIALYNLQKTNNLVIQAARKYIDHELVTEIISSPDADDEYLIITEYNNMIEIELESADKGFAVLVVDTYAKALASEIIEEYSSYLISQIEQKEKSLEYYEERIIKFEEANADIDQELLYNDPYYLGLRSELAEITRDLFNYELAYQNFVNNKPQLLEQMVSRAGQPTEETNNRLPLNIAVAAVLGLMLGGFTVFMVPLFKEVKEELESTKNAD